MSTEERRWTDDLNDEDLAFIRRFVLASGSLKELAAAYGISYPTVRARLDRLIEKIQLIEAAAPESGFERALRAELADGRIDAATLKRVLRAHQKALDEKKGGTR